MLAQKKKPVLALSVAATLLILAGLAYGADSANWVPLGIFTVGLLEWAIATLWARSAGANALVVVGVMTAVNANADYFAKALTGYVIIYNPDGVLYVVLNSLAYSVGSGIGAMLAVSLFPKKGG